MRVLCFLLLAFMIGVIGIFAVQNREMVSLSFLQFSIVSPLSLVFIAAYFLGMFSGWSVIGMLQRTIERVRSPATHGH